VLFITPRERDVLQLLAAGTARRTIADRLGMSDRELDESLLPALFTRLDATCESDALAAATRRGLLTPRESALLMTDWRPTSLLAGL
jgi:DNA-binding NarL/FixJ family response regulator